MATSMSQKTKALALSALLCALGVILLYLGALIEVLDLSVAALASLLVMIAVIELGGWYPYLIYAVTSLLALLLLPAKFPAAIYLLLAGYYPILKAALEKRRRPRLAWLVKLLVFNAALTLVLLGATYLLTGDDAFLWSSAPMWYALTNPTFVLFDIALTRLITVYRIKLRKRLGFR